MAKSNSKVTKRAANKTPATEQLALAELGRQALSFMRESNLAGAERQARQAEADRRILAEERNGITLKGKRLEQARKAVSDINLGAVAAHRLAMDACETSESAQWYAMAIENIAKVIARKCDVISALMNENGRPEFGNFEDEFEPLTLERAAELEREEQQQLAGGH
jgi:hypothetical protein